MANLRWDLVKKAQEQAQLRKQAFLDDVMSPEVQHALLGGGIGAGVAGAGSYLVDDEEDDDKRLRAAVRNALLGGALGGAGGYFLPGMFGGAEAESDIDPNTPPSGSPVDGGSGLDLNSLVPDLAPEEPAAPTIVPPYAPGKEPPPYRGAAPADETPGLDLNSLVPDMTPPSSNAPSVSPPMRPSGVGILGRGIEAIGGMGNDIKDTINDAGSAATDWLLRNNQQAQQQPQRSAPLPQSGPGRGSALPAPPAPPAPSRQAPGGVSPHQPMFKESNTILNRQAIEFGVHMAKQASEQAKERARGKDILNMRGAGGFLADYLAPGAWGGERAGRAEALMRASQGDPSFNVKHPITSQLLGMGTGAVAGAGLGAAAHLLAGRLGYDVKPDGIDDGPMQIGGGLGALAGYLIPAILRRKEMKDAVKRYDDVRDIISDEHINAPEFSSAATALAPLRGPHRAGQVEAVRSMLGQEGGVEDKHGLGRDALYAGRALPYVGGPLGLAHTYAQNIGAAQSAKELNDPMASKAVREDAALADLRARIEHENRQRAILAANEDPDSEEKAAAYRRNYR
tara:strand:- start:2265 stop:3968 length:1704 start_codon:yes stop_codon:yes gene_type:complete